MAAIPRQGKNGKGPHLCAGSIIAPAGAYGSGCVCTIAWKRGSGAVMSGWPDVYSKRQGTNGLAGMITTLENLSEGVYAHSDVRIFVQPLRFP